MGKRNLSYPGLKFSLFACMRSKGVFIKYGVGGSQNIGGVRNFLDLPRGWAKKFSHHQGGGSKILFELQTALERQFSPKKNQNFRRSANSTILSKYITLLHFLHVIETHTYISNLFSHKNMYCLGPGYSRKGTLESDLKNLGGGVKIF